MYIYNIDKYFEALPARRPCIRPYRIIYVQMHIFTNHIYPAIYAPLIESQLPRYGNVHKKRNPWVGTTGAGRNCPERESESPGEDIIFEG